jgi:hypothetical protein
MKSADLDGGQGRNRTTDTRIFRGDNGLRVSRWPDMQIEYANGCLFRPRDLYSDPISPENRAQLATTRADGVT